MSENPGGGDALPLVVDSGPSQPQPSDTDDGSRSGSGGSGSRSTVMEQPSSEFLPGTHVPLISNYIRLKILPGGGGGGGGIDHYFEYSVTFEPEQKSLSVRKRIIRQLEGEDVEGISIMTWPRIILTDGYRVYLPNELERKETTFKCTYPFDLNVGVRLTLTFIEKKETRKSIDLFRALFNRVFQVLGFAEMRRGSFYDPLVCFELPAYKLLLWPGLVTRVRELEGDLMLFLDIRTRVWKSTTLYDIFDMLRDLPDFEAQFTEKVVGRIVLTRYNSMHYKIYDVAWGLTPNSTFILNKRELTYVEYFKRCYGIEIKDPTQPMVVVQLGSPRPGVTKLLTLVPELCYLSQITEDNDAKLMFRDLRPYTKLSPFLHFDILAQYLRKLRGSPECMKLIHSWGLDISKDFVKVVGSVATAPAVSLNSELTLPAVSPDFSTFVLSNVILDPVPIKRWLIVCAQGCGDCVKRIIMMYPKVCVPLGIKVLRKASEVVIVRSDLVVPSVQEYRDAIFKKVTSAKNPFQFALIIIPNKTDTLYTELKRLCLNYLNLQSQVIASARVSSDWNVCSSLPRIALQINCKLGGALWALRIPEVGRLMFIGIDTYHDPQRSVNSCFAFIASLNTSCTKYYSRAAYQPVHTELGIYIRGIFVDALRAYHDDNGCWPDKVIVFRDGVSRIHFDMIKEIEISVMQSVLDLIKPRPTLMFSIVMKTIDEKLVMQTRGNKIWEPPAGTVVDHTLNRRTPGCLYDFHLVSQIWRKSTVCPTHYMVLEDEGALGPKVIQKLAYSTTFMYYNWLGSITVPAMAQYAHKLASLVGRHLKTEPIGMERLLYYL